MNVTPSRHTVALNLEFFSSSFVIYFDNKRYILESLIIFGIMLWSPISILYVGNIFCWEKNNATVWHIDDQVHAQLF